jgi:hypothetical protein
MRPARFDSTTKNASTTLNAKLPRPILPRPKLGGGAGRLVGLVELVLELFADDRHLIRRFDANPNATLGDANDSNRDLVADQNSLAGLA